MKRQLQILAALVLIAAAINPLVALMCIKSGSDASRVPMKVNVSGPGAAGLGWPIRGPHDQPWPDPTQISRAESFGYVRVDGWSAESSPRKTTHQMKVEWMGWPLPVLEVRQFWWPWKDPAWASSKESDPSMGVHWLGTTLNPIIAGSSIWLVLFGPVLLWRTVRRMRRRRHGLCRHCGYPIGVSELCTECGAVLSDVCGVEPDAAG